jgi:hypothetical protein
MITLIPELLFRTDSIFSVSCTSDRGDALIVTLEHSRTSGLDEDEEDNGRVLLKRFKTFSRHPTFELVAQNETLMPGESSASTIIRDGHLMVLYELNRTQASVFGLWQISDSKTEPQLVSLRPLGISREFAKTIVVPSDDLWSTTGLSAKQWLFHPRLCEGINGQLLAAYNLVDARAIVWDAKSAAPGSPPIALIPNVLDPVMLRSGERLLVAWRKPSSGWKVHSNSRSYSRYGQPKPLPLFLSELRGNRVMPLIAASEEKPIATPRMFEAATDGIGRIVFAVVEGSDDEPELNILLSENVGSDFRTVGHLRLRGIPKQMSIALYPSGVIVSLFTQREKSIEVEGIQLNL